MVGRTIFAENLESVAAELIQKYPEGRLSEIEISWPCAIAVRAPVDGLDTPRAVIRGSYQEVRAFEVAYGRARIAAKMAAPRQVLSSKGDQVYDVTATSCTCKGFHYRGHCKHVDAVREHMVAEA